jgi:hypothetical protein
MDVRYGEVARCQKKTHDLQADTSSSIALGICHIPGLRLSPRR